jgi:hypothetical protein
MLEFGLSDMKKLGSDAVRKRMIVIYANALKLRGTKRRAKKYLMMRIGVHLPMITEFVSLL